MSHPLYAMGSFSSLPEGTATSDEERLPMVGRRESLTQTQASIATIRRSQGGSRNSIPSGAGRDPPPPNQHRLPAVRSSVPKEIISILEKHQKDRTPEDLRFLYGLTHGLRSFERLPEHLRELLCRVIRYRRYPEDHVIFEEGHDADGFYVVLHGTVRLYRTLGGDSGNDPQQSLTLAVLSTGDSFGELSLVNNQPRAATACCSDDSELFFISRLDYDYVLKVNHEREVEEKVEFLHGVPAFQSWPRSSLAKLSDILTVQHFLPNKVIVKQGDEPEAFYFLKAGECRVLREISFSPDDCARTKAALKEFLDTDIVPPPTTKSPTRKKKGMAAKKKRPEALTLTRTASRATSLRERILSPSPDKHRPVPQSPGQTQMMPTATTTMGMPGIESPAAEVTAEAAAGAAGGGAAGGGGTGDEAPPGAARQGSGGKGRTRMLEVSMLGPGDYFGEVALLNPNVPVRTATVISMTNVEVLVLSKSDCLRRIMGRPLEIIKENMEKYASDDELRFSYFEQKHWESYKRNLVKDVVRNHQRRRHAGDRTYGDMI